jgi:hypothetical protein
MYGTQNLKCPSDELNPLTMCDDKSHPCGYWCCFSGLIGFVFLLCWLNAFQFGKISLSLMQRRHMQKIEWFFFIVAFTFFEHGMWNRFHVCLVKAIDLWSIPIDSNLWIVTIQRHEQKFLM